MICTRLRPGHLSVRVGDSSRRCEEIVKKSRIAPLNAIIMFIIIIKLSLHTQCYAIFLCMQDGKEGLYNRGHSDGFVQTCAFVL